MFKKGDVVERLTGCSTQGMNKGECYTVAADQTAYNSVSIDGFNAPFDPDYFELVSKKFDFKTKPWFIRVDNIEESLAAQEWLFAQGVTWCDGSRKVNEMIPFSPILTNYFAADDGINTGGFMHSNMDKRYNGTAREIKLTFIKSKVVVDQAVMPEVKSAQQLKIEELEETIRKASEEIQELKKGV